MDFQIYYPPCKCNVTFFHFHLFYVSQTTHVRTCWSAQSCAWSSLPLALIDCETWMLTLVRRLKTISKKLSPSKSFSTTDCGTRWKASHPTIISGYVLKLKQVCYIFTSVELSLKEAVTVGTITFFYEASNSFYMWAFQQDRLWRVFAFGVSLKWTFRGTTVVWTCCLNSADSNSIYFTN